MELLKQAQGLLDYMVEIRRHLHKNPELSLQEHETAAYIAARLGALGIPCETVAPTGVLGRVKGGRGEGPRVLLRADIDAMPICEAGGAEYTSTRDGVMHACGHDAHVAGLLGAAKLLAEMRDGFAGEVLLVFQPAEEFGSGSRYFLQPGVLPEYTRAFGIHVCPDYPAGTVALTAGPDAAAVDYYKVTLGGKNAHISKPEEAQDALQAAARLAPALKAIPSRIVNPLTTALVGVGCMRAGTTYNVIAGEAVIEGTVRSLDDDVQQRLKEEISRLSAAVAAEFGCRAETEFEFFCSSIHNHPEAFAEARAVAEGLLGADKVHTGTPVLLGMAGDDFAQYLKRAPGLYAHLGIANPTIPGAGHPLHANDFDLDEAALPLAAALHAGYALHVLGGEVAR